jgi:hypothetical protein
VCSLELVYNVAGICDSSRSFGCARQAIDTSNVEKYCYKSNVLRCTFLPEADVLYIPYTAFPSPSHHIPKILSTPTSTHAGRSIAWNIHIQPNTETNISHQLLPSCYMSTDNKILATTGGGVVQIISCLPISHPHCPRYITSQCRNATRASIAGLCSLECLPISLTHSKQCSHFPTKLHLSTPFPARSKYIQINSPAVRAFLSMRCMQDETRLKFALYMPFSRCTSFQGAEMFRFPRSNELARAVKSLSWCFFL